MLRLRTGAMAAVMGSQENLLIEVGWFSSEQGIMLRRQGGSSFAGTLHEPGFGALHQPGYVGRGLQPAAEFEQVGVRRGESCYV